ncbi:MAG: TrkH family potassium uptake protein [Clostridia bacterium]|nr:TrkH family potassium uptake protein [Clostridia bacterium]
MNNKLTLKLVGSVLTVEAILLLLPTLVSLVERNGDWKYLLLTAAIVAVVGFAMSRLRPENENLRAREGFAVVTLSWILLSFFGGLPFFFSGQIPSLVDCFFETVSGFTSTGATILTNVESLGRGMAFWRSFTHWAGGMGVLVMSLAIIPKMGPRAIHLMRAESPGPSTDKLVPRLGRTAQILYWLYIGLSVLMVISLLVLGMTPYDALIHTFGAAGTGGFSNYNASIAAFNSPAIEVVIGIFMALFGVNFSIYYYLVHRNWRGIKSNSEVKVYLVILFGAVAIITLNILPLYGNQIGTALRNAFFQVSSIMTTTGYATADFDVWPQLSRTLLVGIMLVGACAGSTGGGMKVIRAQLLVKSMVREIRRTIHPRTVNNVKLDGRTVDEGVISGVYGFFFAYIFVLILSTLIISLDGFSFETNVTAVIATLSNIGPGLGAVGPTGNFAGFSILSKLVLSLCMLIGRLEIFPILMLFMPDAWRKM